jgi:hypothetical protein
MKKSNNLVVHLTTGFMWLLSIQTSKKEAQEALEEAAALAIKNDLNFSYIKDDNIYNYIEELKEYDDDLKDLTDDEILELYNYYYIDLSEYELFNIYVKMDNTKIDNIIYNNTYLINDLK